MCKALAQTHTLLQAWLSHHPDCFPPIVINITDGESTDGDPGASAEDIKHLRSQDGEVLLFNVHLSSHRAAPIKFPDAESGLPDQFAQLLFRMASPLPPYLRNLVEKEGNRVSDGTRGFVFNADIVSVIQFLDIGTRPSNLR